MDEVSPAQLGYTERGRRGKTLIISLESGAGLGGILGKRKKNWLLPSRGAKVILPSGGGTLFYVEGEKKNFHLLLGDVRKWLCKKKVFL